MLELLYTLLGWTFTALPFVVAFLFAMGLILLVTGMYFSPLVGGVAILLLFLLETFFVHLFGFKLGISVYPQDLLFVPMALVALLRLTRPGAMKRLPWPLWVLTGMMSLSFALGLVQHGSTAGVEFRSDFYFMVGVFYFSSFSWSPQQISRLFGWLFPVVLCIMAIVWFRWASDAFNLDWVDPLWHYDAFVTGLPLRVINAQQTMMLGQALILLVFAMAMGSVLAGWRFLVPFLGLTVLVLQHRSVWVAAFLPALMALVIVRQSQGRLAARLAVIAAVSSLVLVPLLATGKFSGATSSVSEAAVKATSTTGGTFVGRVEGWDALLKQWTAAGPRAWVIGNPYGSGFARPEGYGGKEIAFAPHNYYVQLLLRVGLIGLLAFVALHVYLLKGAVKLAGEPHGELTGYAMIGLLFSLLLFDIPYSPYYPHGLFTGLMLALILQHGRQGDAAVDSARRMPEKQGVAA
ncbi:MAG: O-antigen ligase family protein [Thiobacillus sp.]|nr:O-antigen ligase family protein [Thiobacillus sp.]